jgi:uncharacterized protein (TIGR03437 family)
MYWESVLLPVGRELESSFVVNVPSCGRAISRVVGSCVEPDVYRRFAPQKRLAELLLMLLLLPQAAALAQAGHAGSRAAFPAVRGLDLGGTAADTKLAHITVSFKRTAGQHAALDRLLRDQQDPSSSRFHAWLTPEEFGKQFGVRQENLEAALAWLKSEGFTIVSTARGRGWVVVSGNVRQAEHAFHTEIHSFQTSDGLHFGPVSALSVSTELDGFVGGVRGLSDFSLGSPRSYPLYNVADGSHALAPEDIDNIYDITYAGESGTGQSIVIVGESDLNLADVQTYRKNFGLPANAPQTILVGSDPGAGVSGAALEALADMELAGAVAPYASLIYVYARNAFDAVEDAIDLNLAPVISMSYGSCEANVSNADAESIQDAAQQANAQGITWIASSGDTGAAGCDIAGVPATHGLSVLFPASLPEVTAVGGTELNEGTSLQYWAPNMNSAGGSALSYIPEIAWNDVAVSSTLFASGGGASSLFSKPIWQLGPGVPGNNARYVPDISFSASPYHDPYVVISGGLPYAFGGTSAGAPIFAGVVALLNERLAASTLGQGVGNVNPILYGEIGSPGQVPTWYHDITAGNNIVPCVSGTPDCVNGSLGYSAGPGYDPVTGLGSIDVRVFVQGLRIPTTTTLAVPASVMVAGPITLTATVTGAGKIVPTANQNEANQDLVQLLQGTGIDDYAYVSSGVASFSESLSPNTWTFSAYFSGDSLFLPSASPPVTFLVTPNAPAPTLISPANQATGIGLGIQLQWNGASYATSYDVYFGSTPSPPLWGNLTSFSCVPTGLGSNATYYWKVVAITASGTISTPVWSFTTTSQAGYAIGLVAGAANFGFSGDGGPAAEAVLYWPWNVAVDRSANVYFSDTGNQRVRKVTPSGIITTVAGTGEGPNSGDGGPAVAAGLAGLGGLAIDSQGNLYIVSGQRVRKVTPDGLISTFAGSDAAGYAGDGGPAAAALFNNPNGLATDAAGNLYIADFSNNCIRKISGGIISTAAGICGSRGPAPDYNDPASCAGFNGPIAVAVDSPGNIYAVDYGNARICKYANGSPTTIAGGGTPNTDALPPDGPAVGASLFHPMGVAVDAAGNVFFTDPGAANFSTGETRVYEVSGGNLKAVAGDTDGLGLTSSEGPANSVLLGEPYGIAIGPSGNIYFSDYLWGQIRVLYPGGQPSLPSISPGGIVSAASAAPPPVAPGSIAAIFGSFGQVPGSQASSVPLPTAIGGLSVQFQSGAISAPIFYASSSQVNVQIPWELAGSSQVAIAATLNGNTGTVASLQLAPFAPGIFAINGQGTGQGVIVDSNYKIVDAVNPASAGGALQIFCTGLGAVNNPPATGSAASVTTLSETTTNPTVSIGGADAAVLFSGLVPGAIGEYQIDVVVPMGVQPGSAVPVVISIGGVASNIVTISVM